MAPSPQLTVDCRIIGHASPRWRNARSEAERIENNEILSRHRANVLMSEFKPILAKELGKYQLKFLDNLSYAENSQPDRTAVFGWEARGQRDSFASSGRDRANDDAQYRRTDIVVRIARSTQDAMPTKVRQRWDRSTKSKFWYVRVGVSAGADAVIGFDFLRLTLRNQSGDEAKGSVAAFAGGLGLKYSGSPYSWSDEVSFSTSSEVGFEDFHGTRVRYTNAGLVVGVGYTRAYLTFYGMGPDAASLQVGGWSAGFQVAADVAEGLLVLDTVPSDYTIDYIDETQWDQIRSDWITEQKLSLYFDDARWALSSDQIGKLRDFATRVATDVRTQ